MKYVICKHTDCKYWRAKPACVHTVVHSNTDHGCSHIMKKDEYGGPCYCEPVMDWYDMLHYLMNMQDFNASEIQEMIYELRFTR